MRSRASLMQLGGTGLLATVLAFGPATASNPSKEPKMTQPAHDSRRDFTFTFRSVTDDADKEITRIDGRTGNVIVFENRTGGDQPGPIGLFAMTAPKAQTEALSAAIEGLKWADLPALTGGDINLAMLSLEYARGSLVIQRDFNAGNRAFLNALGPVMRPLETILRAASKAPVRAIDLSVARTEHGFKLVLRNVGTGPVMFTDARQPRRLPGQTCGRVVIEARGGGGSDDVPLRPATGPLAAVVLGPGQTHEVETVPWTPPHPGQYYVGATWEDYGGPKVDSKDVMPEVPAPTDKPDARPFLIRGAAFTKGFEFTVDKPRHP